MTVNMSVTGDLTDRIAAAAMELRVATAHNDCTDMIDWATTIQKLTAELVASVITNVRNI